MTLVEFITTEIGRKYPGLPVDAHASQDDDQTVLVKVFDVPEHLHDEITAYVYHLEAKTPRHHRKTLIPMLKSVEVTKHYYPHHSKEDLDEIQRRA